MMKLFTCAALLLASSLQTVQSGPVVLTVENLDEVILDKAVFIMFYDAYPEDDDDNDDNIYLQATWNKLAKEWEGHEHGVIAKVDCGDTEAAVEICQHFDIPSLPSFAWGGSMSWEPYFGSKDLESLSRFAKEKISKPICSVYETKFCEEEEAEIITRLLNMPITEFDSLVEVAQNEFLKVTDAFDASGNELIANRDAVVNKVNANIDEIVKKVNFQFVDQVLRTRGLKKREDYDDDDDDEEENDDEEEEDDDEDDEEF